MSLLPSVVTIRTRSDLLPLAEPLSHALRVIAERHHLDVQRASPATTGSAPVFLADRWAIKLVPPQWKSEFDAELLATEHVHRRLTVRTASVHARGMIDAWSYAVFERINEPSLRDVSGSLTNRDRVRVAAQLGEALASLHGVDTKGLDSLCVDWSAFARERTQSACDFQARYGLSPAAVATLPALFDAAKPLIVDDRRALLHADLHHEHVLVTLDDHGWNVHAIIDFGDAVIGHPEYELITPVFLALGPQREALLALFAALGFRCDEQSATRLTAWSAMHKFNALARFLPRDHGEDALSVLREQYWPRVLENDAG